MKNAMNGLRVCEDDMNKKESEEIILLFTRLANLESEICSKISRSAEVKSVNIISINISEDGLLRYDEIFLALELEIHIDNVDMKDLINLSSGGEVRIINHFQGAIYISFRTSYNYTFNRDGTVTSSFSKIME